MMKFKVQRNLMANSLRNGICLLLTGVLSVGSPLKAGEPHEIRSSDVVRNSDELLKGTVMNTAAQPIAGVEVSVLHKDKVVANSTSNDQGEFSFKGLRNGAYVVKAGSTRQAVRLWGTNSAPPAAIENIALVVDEETVRGQGALGALGAAGGGGIGAGTAAAAAAAAIGGYVVYDQVIADDSKTPASP